MDLPIGKGQAQRTTISRSGRTSDASHPSRRIDALGGVGGTGPAARPVFGTALPCLIVSTRRGRSGAERASHAAVRAARESNPRAREDETA